MLCFLLLLLFYVPIFFDSYFVEILAAFNCSEALFFIFSNQQLSSRQNLLRNTWRDSFLIRFKGWWLWKIMPEILTTSSRAAINGLLRFFVFCFLFFCFVLLCFFCLFFCFGFCFLLFFLFFLFSFIMTHCKYSFEILFYVTFVLIKEKKIYK